MNGIIFTDHSIQQILRGLKTQTRRVKEGPRCFYGPRGIRFYALEAWRQAYKPTPEHNGVVYRADYGFDPSLDASIAREQGYWKAPLLLKEHQARLVIEVTRTPYEEPIQSISDKDIEAEGVVAETPALARSMFNAGWNSINAHRGYPIEKNPVVYVVHFKVVIVKTRLHPSIKKQTSLLNAQA